MWKTTVVMDVRGCFLGKGVLRNAVLIFLANDGCATADPVNIYCLQI